jgi:undecaprenyl-diphosphatase
LFERVRPDVAARFSFLLGIPAVVGAEILEFGTMRSLDPDSRHAILVGTIIAGLTGALAIWCLMRVMASRRLHYFAYYLWPLGVFVLAMNWGRGG